MKYRAVVSGTLLATAALLNSVEFKLGLAAVR